MRVLAVVLAILSAEACFAERYRGRVEYASTGKPLAKVVVEAKTREGINVFFWIPWDPTKIVGRATTAADGTFEFHLSKSGRVRFAARGFYLVKGAAAFAPEIIARSNTVNVIKVPHDFKPWHPRPPQT